MTLDGEVLKGVEGSPNHSVVCKLLKKGNIAAEAIRVARVLGAPEQRCFQIVATFWQIHV